MPVDIYSQGNSIKKYFPQYYVGMKDDVSYISDPAVPGNLQTSTTILGFATPYELTKAGEKRRSTVDGWARGWYGQNKQTKYPAVIVDNTPKDFEVISLIRRSYRTNNVLWRIKHPDGFELEITSENLSMIIEEVGILKGGRIPNKCVFIRIGSQNHLIPEGTRVWNEAVIPALNYLEI